MQFLHFNSLLEFCCCGIDVELYCTSILSVHGKSKFLVAKKTSSSMLSQLLPCHQFHWDRSATWQNRRSLHATIDSLATAEPPNASMAMTVSSPAASTNLCSWTLVLLIARSHPTPTRNNCVIKATDCAIGQVFCTAATLHLPFLSSKPTLSSITLLLPSFTVHAALATAHSTTISPGTLVFGQDMYLDIPHRYFIPYTEAAIEDKHLLAKIICANDVKQIKNQSSPSLAL